jgi:hypothetical protein
MKQFKHIVASGNSFTQDGLGGGPPGEQGDGCCSFNSYDGEDPAVPRSWVSWVAKRLEPLSFVNTAACYHGNFMITDTLTYLLSNYRYAPADTLVLFNISMPTRLDIPCEFGHPDQSPWLYWSPGLIPWAYLDRQSRTQELMEKHMGLDNVPRLSWQRMDTFCGWLENRGYNYLFLTTEDYTAVPEFQKLIAPRPQRFVPLEPGVGMAEWAKATQNNTENNYHPDELGRTLIAGVVMDRIRDL